MYHQTMDREYSKLVIGTFSMWYVLSLKWWPGIIKFNKVHIRINSHPPKERDLKTHIYYIILSVLCAVCMGVNECFECRKQLSVSYSASYSLLRESERDTWNGNKTFFKNYTMSQCTLHAYASVHVYTVTQVCL